MKKTLLLITVTVILGNVCKGVPVYPIGLRGLFRDADVVVVGKVQKIEPVKYPQDPWYNTKAIIDVSSILKGELKSKSISVFYQYEKDGFSCPAPARYPAGSVVLAFLEPRETGDGFKTYANSYGTKPLDDSGLKIYLARIKELEKINSISDIEKRHQQTADWLVKCVEDEATRREGLVDLEYPEIREFIGEDLPNKDESKYIKYLNKDLNKRLLNVLASATPETEDNNILLMSILARTIKNKELKYIADTYRKISWTNWSKEKKQAKQMPLIPKFVAKYKELNDSASADTNAKEQQ